MKNLICIPVACILILMTTCNQSDKSDLSGIDPGSYDSTWWNRTPIRLIQTNLPEIEGSMNRDEYVRSILDASANAVLFNTGGIVANYQTKLEYQWKNPNIGENDLVADIIQKLHEHGIRYIARFDFSKLDSKIAIRKPEWLYMGTNGQPQIFNGLYSACINGGYYQEYAFEILKEAITNYDLDGIFFNMMGYTGSDYSGKHHGICQCENCKLRFKKYTGLTLPKFETDPGITEYRQFQKETSEELYNRITVFIKQLNPDLVIYNYNAIGTSWIASESGASMNPGVDNIYHATINVKRTLGSYKDRTPLNLIMGFQAIGYRNIMSSPNLLRTWWLENMLHGAPVSFVVVGTLVHYEDRKFIPVVNELFAFHRNHEKLFTNVQAVNNIAIVQGAGGEFQGIIKLLSEQHIMYDIILPDQLGSSSAPRRPADYDLIILGDVENMSNDLISALDSYVGGGGKLLVTGATSTKDERGNPLNRIRLQSLGVEPEFEVFQKSQATYLKVSDGDKKALGQNEFRDFSLIMMNSEFLKCRIRKDARGFLRLLPSNMYGPAEKTYYKESDITDFPGAVAFNYGKGMTIFIPWMIGADYNFKGNYAQKALFVTSIKNLLNIEPDIVTDASPMIEITHLANLNGKFEWIGMINHSGFMGNSICEPVVIHNTKIRFRPVKPINEIILLRSGFKPGFHQSADEWVECLIPRISDFEMLLCLYK